MSILFAGILYSVFGILYSTPGWISAKVNEHREQEAARLREEFPLLHWD